MSLCYHGAAGADGAAGTDHSAATPGHHDDPADHGGAAAARPRNHATAVDAGTDGAARDDQSTGDTSAAGDDHTATAEHLGPRDLLTANGQGSGLERNEVTPPDTPSREAGVPHDLRAGRPVRNRWQRRRPVRNETEVVRRSEIIAIMPTAPIVAPTRAPVVPISIPMPVVPMPIVARNGWRIWVVVIGVGKSGTHAQRAKAQRTGYPGTGQDLLHIHREHSLSAVCAHCERSASRHGFRGAWALWSGRPGEFNPRVTPRSGCGYPSAPDAKHVNALHRRSGRRPARECRGPLGPDPDTHQVGGHH